MRGPEDRQQRASRLRIGGWLGNQAPAPGAPISARSQPVAESSEPAGVAAQRGVGSHRMQNPRRWLLAAAIAVTLFVAGVVISFATDSGTDPVSVAPLSPAASPRPIFATTAPASYLPPSSAAPSGALAPPAAETPEPAEPPPAPTTPPARTGTARPPQHVTPLLTLATTAVPAVVNLSAEGSLDWVHWGLTNAGSLNRKSGGSGAIRDAGGTSRGRYDTNPQRFSWTGGTPAGSASGTPTGVYTCGTGGNFAIQVSASPTTRTLHLYAGAWLARGRLTARLGAETVTGSVTDRDASTTTARFVIRFRAAAGANLSITWTTAESFNSSCGNVDIQAATLS
jgi:hypothetical protein